MKRKLYYDYIRILACFLVILNHTIAIFYKFNKVPLKTWLVADILFFICKIAVPLFLMLSGALLLGKEESYKKVFINKIIKTTMILLIWSLIYKSFYSIYYNHKLLSFNEMFWIIKGIKDKPVSTHLWYLYMLIGIYAMTPFIRKMVHNFKQKDYLVFLILWFIFSTLIPFIKLFYPIKYTGFFQVPLFVGYIGYYVAGYFADNVKIDKKTILLSSILVIIGIIISAVYTFNLSVQHGKTYKSLDNALIFPIALSAIASFVLLKEFGIFITDKIRNKHILNKITVQISGTIFGIYLIHIIIIFLLLNINPINILFIGYDKSIIKTLFLDCIVFVISFFIITLIKKIPILKNII